MSEMQVTEEAQLKLCRIYSDVFVEHGVTPSVAEFCFDRISRCYAETHRRYHTLAHIAHCMTELSQVVTQAKKPDVILAAIFYHDVVYDTGRKDNEEKSVQYWKFDARQILELKDEQFIDEVARLILLTKHHRTDPHLDFDAALFLDIDLSILGAEALVYDAYADAVREEYSHFDDNEWASLRMEKFIDPTLEEERIFLTEYFYMRYNEFAVANLKEERVRYQAN